jgi:hypothetical protein
MAVHDMPATPVLRELKKVPTPGFGQARGKPAFADRGAIQHAGCVMIVHSDALSIS